MEDSSNGGNSKLAAAAAAAAAPVNTETNKKQEKLLLLARQLKAKNKKLEAEREDLQAQLQAERRAREADAAAAGTTTATAPSAVQPAQVPAANATPLPPSSQHDKDPELFWGLITRAPALQQRLAAAALGGLCRCLSYSALGQLRLPPASPAATRTAFSRWRQASAAVAAAALQAAVVESRRAAQEQQVKVSVSLVACFCLQRCLVSYSYSNPPPYLLARLPTHYPHCNTECVPHRQTDTNASTR